DCTPLRPQMYAARLRVSSLLPRNSDRGSTAYSVVGRIVRVGRAYPDRLAGELMARTRDALRTHRGGWRRISAHGGCELDGGAGICGLAPCDLDRAVGSRARGRHNLGSLAVRARRRTRSRVPPRVDGLRGAALAAGTQSQHTTARSAGSAMGHRYRFLPGCCSWRWVG